MKSKLLNAFTFSQFRKHAERPVEWIVENLVPDEGTTLVVGHPHSGKTRLINAIIAARTKKARLAGLKVKPGHTILCSLEHGKSLVLQGLLAAAKGQGVKSLDVTVIRPPLNAQDPDVLRSLEARIQTTGADLVIFDCTRRMGAHNEDSSAEVSALLQWLAPIAEKCAIILIHHLSKNAGVARGSTDWVAGTDSILTLKKTAKGVSIKAEHHHTGDQQYALVVKGDEEDELLFEQASEADPTSHKLKEAILAICKETPVGKRALRAALRASGIHKAQMVIDTAALQLKAKKLLTQNEHGKWTVTEKRT